MGQYGPVTHAISQSHSRILDSGRLRRWRTKNVILNSPSSSILSVADPRSYLPFRADALRSWAVSKGENLEKNLVFGRTIRTQQAFPRD